MKRLSMRFRAGRKRSAHAALPGFTRLRAPAQGGSILVVCLLITLLLLTMGMYFVAAKRLQYERGVLSAQFAIAGAIAESGLEDARIKLEKDPSFPPVSADQPTYSYSEDVFDLDGATLLGSYTVSIDTTFNVAPYRIIKISSIGLAGPSDEPLAKKKIHAEFDMAQKRPDTAPTPNPNYFKFINRWESGSL